MQSKHLLVAITFSFFIINSNAQAQEKDLDPVTITASVSPEKSSRTGRNLIVLSGEQFNALPVHSIDELLRYIPGVEVQARGPLGSQSDIVLRGGTFQQVLVILDGVRLNDPNTGHFSSYIPIAPSEINRIEVLKGASSAIYGSEAVGGVIYIITKTFAQQQNAGKAVQMQITGGEYNLFSANAGGYISNGKTSFAAGLLTNNTTGQQQRGIRGYVNAHTLSGSFSHQLSKNTSISFRSAYDDRDFAAQNFYTTFISDTSTERVKTFWNQLQLQTAVSNHTLRGSVGYKKLNDKFRFNSASAPNDNTSNLLQALVTDEIKLDAATTVVAGAQFINKQIESNDRGNHAVQQAAAFSLIRFNVGSLFASPAMRLEWNERAGWELVPQINLAYRTTHLQLRGSAGKTIRDADFTERYNNYNKTLVTSGRIGNPELTAEKSFSYEAGVDVFTNAGLKISGTYFQRLQKDLIDYAPTAYMNMPRKENLVPNGTYALAKNISEVTTTGFEADLQYISQLQGGQQLWSTLGFIYLNSTSDNSVPSFYISSHARYLTNFNIRYSNRLFAIATNGIYKNRAPQNTNAAIAKVSADYFVLNVKAEAFLLQKKAALFIELDNVLNTNYADLLGSQMPGRWFMGGFKISLTK